MTKLVTKSNLKAMCKTLFEGIISYMDSNYSKKGEEPYWYGILLTSTMVSLLDSGETHDESYASYSDFLAKVTNEKCQGIQVRESGSGKAVAVYRCDNHGSNGKNEFHGIGVTTVGTLKDTADSTPVLVHVRVDSSSAHIRLEQVVTKENQPYWAEYKLNTSLVTALSESGLKLDIDEAFYLKVTNPKCKGIKIVSTRSGISQGIAIPRSDNWGYFDCFYGAVITSMANALGSGDSIEPALIRVVVDSYLRIYLQPLLSVTEYERTKPYYIDVTLSQDLRLLDFSKPFSFPIPASDATKLNEDMKYCQGLRISHIGGDIILRTDGRCQGFWSGSGILSDEGLPYYMNGELFSEQEVPKVTCSFKQFME